jgi:hypothetical protein
MNRYLLKSEASMAGVQAVNDSFIFCERLHGTPWRREGSLAACSEIIPFKLDLDNSSERTKLLLDAPPPLCWHADRCSFICAKVIMSTDKITFLTNWCVKRLGGKERC